MGVHDGHRRRKKEQFLRTGLDSFADHEVLELLLYYAIPRRDTNELAHRLLERFGTLQNVFDAPVEELQKVEGTGKSAAILLTLISQAGRRALRTAQSETSLADVEACGRYFTALLSHQRRETLYVACLDAKGKLLACKQLSLGGADSAPLPIRQVVENALLTNASAVVLAHNHPSGVALPSKGDCSATLRVQEALQTMDIRLVDHIVVADKDFVSMAQSGYLLP